MRLLGLFVVGILGCILPLSNPSLVHGVVCSRPTSRPIQSSAPESPSHFSSHKTLRLRGGGPSALSGHHKELFDTVLKRRFFFGQAFAIHGGSSGLFDLGPCGAIMKQEILAIWRQTFVIEENLLEVSCPVVTPAPVLAASGHEERFTDLMVQDVKTGECFRADKLLEEFCEKESSGQARTEEELACLAEVSARAASISASEFRQIMQELNVTAPTTGNALSDPYPFNLMFSTTIGPSGTSKAYLRPETAQGIFTNFKKLLDFNAGKLPFGAAQTGKAYRNEIAPKQGLLRVREFEMAEIEYFLARNRSDHQKFSEVSSLEVNLLSGSLQAAGAQAESVSLKAAVTESVIGSEALAYFMGKTFLFLRSCGFTESLIRFRQHRAGEMAHYARDCWDAEVLTSFGWVEVVGHADRACYDLEVHSAATGTPLVAWEEFDEPIESEVVVPEFNKGLLGKTFKGSARTIMQYLEKLCQTHPEEAMNLQAELSKEGTKTLIIADQNFELLESMVKFQLTTQKQFGINFTPGVIEPSFGIDRILYCMLEASFYVREDDQQRTVLRLPAAAAPYKCCVLSLTSSEQLQSIAAQLLSSFRALGIKCKADDSAAAIGRRYARMDEIGVPFAVTVDLETASASTVTVRERDSMEQVRIGLNEVSQVIHSLISFRHLESFQTWENIKAKFPLYQCSGSEQGTASA